MDQQASPKSQLIDRLKSANNILVTVRTNPSVDLLSACIGLTLVLDKQGKHAAAVFSGEVPSTIEFLKPEATLETNTDSLRDFIIALDKSKADKLRYKVEDKMVRIFITPYRTSLSQDDLVFEQGDFNVDAVVALGAHKQEELDEAITAHGRILHDATVMSINNTADGNLGSINWQDISASSVCELVVQLVDELGKDMIDQQVATALLTGIVSETERFSNEKTTPRTMSLAGELMTAGANQQLVATQLQENSEQPSIQPVGASGRGASKQPVGEGGKKASEEKKTSDGTLEIDHKIEEKVADKKPDEEPRLESKPDSKGKSAPEPSKTPESPAAAKSHSGRDMLPMPDDSQLTGAGGNLLSHSHPFTKSYAEEEDASTAGPHLVDVPSLPGAQLPPVSMPSPAPTLPPVSTPTSLAVPTNMPLASAGAAQLPTNPTASPPPAGNTLQDIEASVHSPHADHQKPTDEESPEDLDKARNAVLEALQQGDQPLEPLQGLSAMPMGGSLHAAGEPGGTSGIPGVDVDAEGNLHQLPQPLHEPAPNPESPGSQPLEFPKAMMNLPPVDPSMSTQSSSVNPTLQPGQNPPPSAPPPGPPPMMPPSFMNPGS